MQTEAILDNEIKDEIQEPKMYKVLLHNDNYTTVDFVVYTLVNIFGKDENEAYKIMRDVHKKGIGIAGIYIYDIAKTKVLQSNTLAKQFEFPFKTTMEEI